MMFGLNVTIFKWEKYTQLQKDGTIKEKFWKGNCSNCKKQIPSGVMIVTQAYGNRFGGGIHKYCPTCSEAGIKELKEATKNIKFRAKIGWDNF
jgi:hypothetical protein